MDHSLKLDASYRPLEIIDSLEAFVLCLVGKASAAEYYKKELKTVKESFKLPAVIILNRIVKFRFNGMMPNRINILWRDKNQCQYCTKIFHPSELTLDHLIPRSRGGRNTWRNLVTACRTCNQKKRDRVPQESGMYPLRKPFKPKHSVLRSVNKNQISELWKDYLWENA